MPAVVVGSGCGLAPLCNGLVIQGRRDTQHFGVGNGCWGLVMAVGAYSAFGHCLYPVGACQLAHGLAVKELQLSRGRLLGSAGTQQHC